MPEKCTNKRGFFNIWFQHVKCILPRRSNGAEKMSQACHKFNKISKSKCYFKNGFGHFHAVKEREWAILQLLLGKINCKFVITMQNAVCIWESITYIMLWYLFPICISNLVEPVRVNECDWMVVFFSPVVAGRCFNKHTKRPRFWNGKNWLDEIKCKRRQQQTVTKSPTESKWVRERERWSEFTLCM